MSSPSKKVLLEFFLTDTVLYTFIIRPDTPELGIKDDSPIVVTASIGQADIERIVEKIRTDYKEIISDNIQAPNYDLSSFYALGEQIFTPELCRYIEGFDALYLVPFGPLHYLPMHAFKVDGHYLIDLFQLAYLPSGSVLEYFKNRSTTTTIDSILLAGVDSTDNDPHFVRETDQIEALPLWNNKKKVYLKHQNCTKEQFFKNASDKAIIHLSTHGCFNDQDPLLSGALLWGKYSNGYIDGEGLTESDYQNILTAKDLFERANLSTELFVLSGCVTGNSENKPGDELIGLTRALIYAGAKTMIVSLFPTFKQITSKIDNPSIRFSNFYKLWLKGNLSKGEAFQKYIKLIKETEQYRHPYNWLQLIMVGDLS